jgi:peptide-methionine (S)-S-oxide reductase
MAENRETATLAGGCFWCTEAVFTRLKGVELVVPGYAGGQTANPTYRDVCTGTTGHAEAVQVTYDPEMITFADLLEVFWRTHDPTTLNRQGADTGTQYRSAIFCHDDRQREIALRSKEAAEAARIWPAPIVTEIVPFSVFYPAEEYHRNYYYYNRMQGYCVMVIDPKIRKLQKDFGDLLKRD